MFSDFLAVVKTDSDRESLIREVDLLIDTNYRVNAGAGLEEKIRSETFSLFQKAKESETNFLGFLKALRQMLMDLETFELTLAIEPSQNLVEEVYSWLKSNLKKPFVLVFRKNTELIAGAEISYQGKYYSLSLDKVLDEEINKVQEPQIFNNQI